MPRRPGPAARASAPRTGSKIRGGKRPCTAPAPLASGNSSFKLTWRPGSARRSPRWRLNRQAARRRLNQEADALATEGRRWAERLGARGALDLQVQVDWLPAAGYVEVQGVTTQGSDATVRRGHDGAERPNLLQHGCRCPVAQPVHTKQLRLAHKQYAN